MQAVATRATGQTPYGRLVFAAGFSSDDGAQGRDRIFPAGRQGAAQITVLSNRADLVSDGNALVAVGVPANASPSDLTMTLNGASATGMFQYDAPRNRMVGLVTGLAVGANQFVASAGGKSARLTITNHPRGGPVISGPHLKPWVCATRVATVVNVAVPGTSLTAPVTTRVSGLDADPTDADCNAPPSSATTTNRRPSKEPVAPSLSSAPTRASSSTTLPRRRRRPTSPTSPTTVATR